MKYLNVHKSSIKNLFCKLKYAVNILFMQKREKCKKQRVLLIE
jgi:hypothetical protein